MKWFNNMKMSYKIILGLILVSVLAGTVTGAIGILKVNEVRNQNSTAYNNIITPINEIAKLETSYQESCKLLRDAIILEDPKTAMAAMQTEFTAMQDAYFALTSLLKDKNALAWLGTVKANMEVYETFAAGIVKQVQRGNLQQAKAAMQQQAASDAETAVTESLDQLEKKMLLLSINANRTNQTTAQNALWVIIAVAAFAVAVAFCLGLLIASAINKPLRKLVKTANRLAAGNLTIDLEIASHDEIGILAKAFGSMAGAIGRLTADINFLVDALAAGNLSARADTGKHHGEFKDIIEGFNSTLEAVVAPVGEVTAVLARVSNNDLTVQVGGCYHGDMKVLAEAANNIIVRLLAIQSIFVDLSKGDLSQIDRLKGVGKRSENDQIIPSAISMMETLQNLMEDANLLSSEAVNGDLAVRGDASKYEGAYGHLIFGINSIIDAMANPLSDAVGALDTMAHNDFTAGMGGGYRGDYASLSESINSVAKTLNCTLGEINSAAEQVASGTRQVSDGSQSLSQGATEQASAIEQLTVSLAEIASQAKQNALNANQASDLAKSARDNAAGGNAQMKELQQAMAEINEASSGISKIIKVIDEIAFQTNLLALNAAVEAARAGQHGRGFAVVAEEVRNLAQRSANAAKETTAMIEGSIHKVKAGTKIANETADALNKIMDGIEKATALVSFIAQASGDQACAVAQVNRGIEQVSQVTQTNSATAEESAAASEELSNQALKLNEMVGRFSLRGGSIAGGQKASFQPMQAAKALTE